MNCQYCDNAIPPGATKCPACGAPAAEIPATPPPAAAPAPQYGYIQQQQPQQQAPVSHKSPGTAGCLSFLICGVGQMYNGQVIKGIVLLIACAVLASFTVGIGGLVVWIVSIVDAAQIAKKINSGKKVGEWEFF